MKRRRRNRWGKLSEISGIKRVGDAAFNRAPTRLKKLSAWRRLHSLAKHSTIRRHARKQGVKPSSNLRLSSMLSKIASLEKRKKH